MRPQRNAPLLIAAVGIAVIGGVALQLMGNAVQSSVQSSTSSNASQNPAGVVRGGTHVEIAPHSPNVQSAGDYHIEALLSREGALELYIYGQKERQLYPIPTIGLDLKMEAKAIISGESSIDIPMKPKPYATDPEGSASRFVGRFDRRPDQAEIGLTGTLPIEGKTYRVQWRPEYLAQGRFSAATDPAMPEAVSLTEAQTLFLTPGGLYTEADIAANDRKTAQEKYGSVMSSHNKHPGPGDRLCPITDTVANDKFTWTVGGKVYKFCCPPCIEEFVKRAKEKPGEIKAPEEYVMR